MVPVNKGEVIGFSYTNWRGENNWRHCVVDSIYFGNTEYHPEDQWLLRGYDLMKREMRDYAMKDMTKVNVLTKER